MKKILSLLILGIFLISLTSAILETKSFDPNAENYGEIQISEWIGISNKADYRLMDYGSSVIDVWAEGEYKLYKKTHLFQGVFYKDTLERRGDLTDEKFFIWENETTTSYNPIYENQNCYIDYSNSTNGNSICENILISNNTITKDTSHWIEYEKNTQLQISEGKWRLEAKRPNNKKIDFVLEAHNKEFTEWAWFNTTWNFKQLIIINFSDSANLSNHWVNFTYIPPENKTASDMSDLRFINFNEDEEIVWKYTNKNSTSIDVFLFTEDTTENITNGVLKFYAYYNTTQTVSYGWNNTFYYGDTWTNRSTRGWTTGLSQEPWILNESLEAVESLGQSGASEGSIYQNLPIEVAGWTDITIDYNATWLVSVSNDGSYLTYGVTDTGANPTDTWIGGFINARTGAFGGSYISNAWASTVGAIQTLGGDINNQWVYGKITQSGNSNSSSVARSQRLNWGGQMNSGSVTETTSSYQFTNNPALHIHSSGYPTQRASISWLLISEGNGTQIDYNVGEETETMVVRTELISPENNFNQTNTEVYFNYNSKPSPDTNLTNTTLYIWYSNGTLLDTVFNSLSGNEIIETTQFYNLTEEDNYLWNAESCGQDVNCSFAEGNFTIIIHFTNPILNIINPIGTYDYHLLGNNLSLNWSVIEEGRNLSEHIINCSYTYNDSITYISINDCININQTNFIYVLDKNSLIFNVTDFFQLKTTNTTNWNFRVIELNQTFEDETTEGNTEEFSANIILESGLSIVGTALVYNGTSFIGSNSESGGITTLSLSDVLITSVTEDTNLTFYWSLVLSDSSIINLSTQNQTVFKLALDDCSSFTNRIFNFTSYDEEMQTYLPNTTKEIALNIYSSDRSTLILNLSDEFETNPTIICLNKVLTEESDYSLDATLRYEALEHTNEYYNIVDLELTKDTEEQKISLYNLNLSDSTEFQLTFTGEDFIPVENALVFVERQYIAENTFKTVELPKTDSNGQTILHLVRNDIIYNIIVMKDKVVLGRFENLIAFCDDFSIGNCKISLNAIGTDSGVPNYNEEIGITFDSSPEYNDTTKLVSFSFTSVDGTSKTILMDVERRDVFGNTSVCSNILVSTSGTISCNVGNISDTNLITTISVDGQNKLNSNVVVETEAYGPIGYVMAFLLTLALILLLGDSRNGVFISLLIGYAIAVAMGWIIGGIIGFGSAGIWILVLTVTGIWLINKNRST